MIHIIFIILLAFATPATARDFDYRAFEQIPVLHEGRVKPLGAFAEIEQKRIGGEGKAAQWLALTLFDPARAAQAPVFETADDRNKGHTLTQALESLAPHAELIMTLAEEKPDNLPPAQRNLLALNDRVLAFSQMLNSLNMILPMDGEDNKTFLDLKKTQEDTVKKIKALIKRKGEKLEKYTDAEKALVAQGMKLDLLAATGHENAILRIVPPQWAGAEWQSPWMTVNGSGGPQGAAYLEHWKNMALAFRAGDGKAFRKAAELAKQSAFTQDKSLSETRFRAELSYRGLKPFRVACILYILSLLFFITRNNRSGYLCGLAACGVHALGLILRIYILERPPVGTLYESLLFVSLVVAVPALLSGFRRHDKRIAICGILGALAVLLVAPVFAPDGDSLGVLVAVLNTNFWLATHVICISAGYGVCVLAASLAHIALWRTKGVSLNQVINRMLAAALFLTATGTMLGGIWADQSWGRFWGWDPKENGALLIVLWLAWLLHGRIAGLLKDRLWLASVAALNIVVALSWFGVNLLNVGLHSYGFTSGIATGLFAFCTAELAFIAYCLYGRKNHAS